MSGWDAGEFEKLADQLARDGHVSAALSLNAAAHNIRNTGRPGDLCDEYCRCRNDVRRVVGCPPPRRPGIDVFHVEPADGAALDIIFDASDESYELIVFALVDCDGECGGRAAEPHYSPAATQPAATPSRSPADRGYPQRLSVMLGFQGC